MDEMVSVIVPVYNVEDYIRKCLDSLVNQTYKQIEIVVVDDGSTDSSAEIIKKEYSFDNVQYVYQNNAGLGAARNAGIKCSHGEYLLFVDSDDWIREDTVEILIKRILSDDSDMCVFDMAYIFSDGTEKKRTPQIHSNICVDNIEALKKEFVGKEYKFHAPNKFCKKKLFTENNIIFSTGKLYEDVSTTYKLFLASRRVSLITDKLYFYLQKRSGSITNSVSKKQFSDMLNALDEIINNYEISKLNIGKELQALYVGNIISLTNYLCKKTVNRETKKLFYKMLLDDKNWYLMSYGYTNNNLTIEHRIRCFMIKNCFGLYSVLLTILKGR